MSKHYELTPKGFFFCNNSEKVYLELKKYLYLIKKNALIFTKNGKSKFVLVKKGK